MIPTLLTLFALATIIGIFSCQAKKAPAGAQLPPGPPGKPIIGNALDIPPYHSWFQFEKWSKKYGPLYRLSIAGRTHVIVSTEKIANDLLRERGTIYSSREQLPMAAQMMSNNLRPLFLPYGETWRKVRKLMHALTNSTVSESYVSVQEQESIRAVRDLAKEPEKYETWFERYSAGLIMRLAYSMTVYTGEEEPVRRILAVGHNVERVASPGAYLVDTFPFLAYIPSWLAPFRREAARLHAEELDLFRTLVHTALQAHADTTKPTNFSTAWHDKKDQYGISDDQAAYTIGTLFEAGAGTTSAAMMSFVLAMTLHREEFFKLQSEIDHVVGKDRLPTSEDMVHIPRVRAVAKEVLRWRPVAAGGLPHMLVKDDVYRLPDGRNMFLPEGTNVHPVQWMIHRDEVLYPDPEMFRPERWLEAGWPTFKEPLTTHPNLQNYSAFGFGRRICPGQSIAERSLYILIARIAWACDISKKIDRHGKEIAPPDYDYVTGFNVS